MARKENGTDCRLVRGARERRGIGGGGVGVEGGFGVARRERETKRKLDERTKINYVEHQINYVFAVIKLSCDRIPQIQ